MDGAPSIRIQALLGGAYFNRLTNYFTFTVGSGGATSYNGISVNNVLLVPGTSYEISYYILFYNATGVRIIRLCVFSESNLIIHFLVANNSRIFLL